MAHGEINQVQDCTVTLAVTDLGVAPVLADELVRAGYRLYGLVPSHQSLEDLFLSLVQESDR
jgi:hypothetical protein